ncbi:sulfite exporter TauE/SafE family protein [Hellea balneolensis]|uniref:sulfite exporter TauE/SafE family protein n=1 Tax=Hellea balneolensis TaxID=287478 RepID=UPI00040BF86C|nr:sulfite exporter TauE/SafE family protein [Hellea balneolensis]
MKIAALILISAAITACISGIFGMAGGMIFMGIIASIMGVAEAMVVHGAVQSVSNSSRAWLLRPDIRWDILGFTLLGALPAIAVLAFIAFVPNKATLFIVLGLLPFILWLPKGVFQGDAAKPVHAILCGAVVMGLNLSAGVAGPALDFFYVKTSLTRKEIVATKAVTMFASHMVKIIYFGLPLIAAFGLTTLPPLWVFAVAVPCIILGTYVGTRILHRLSDVHFKSYTKYLVTVVGIIYLWRGLTLAGMI